jgi:hypothetical protein
MNLSIKNKIFEADGIFGLIFDDQGNKLASTLQHAYDSGQGNGTFVPKIPDGVFTCIRGNHRLESMNEDFETFEITGVTGHTNILFHWGNYNRDSSGCVLLGSGMANINGTNMLLHSKDTFDRFMKIQDGVNTFTLTVTSGD